MEKHAAIYARCSTTDQTTNSQIKECREWCKKNSEPNTKDYIDTASGAACSRKALDRMMADMKAGKLSAIVCYKLDRLGRSLPHLVQMIAEFEKHKVAFICTSQNIDTRAGNPAGRLQMHVLMAVAEFERSLIRERTKAGLCAAKDRGAVLGRPRGRRIKLPIAQWKAVEGSISLREFCRQNKVKESTMRKALKEDPA